MKVVEKKKIWFGLSIAIIVVGLIMGMIQGFNLGIDFTGGTMMQIDLKKQVSVNEINEVIKKFDLDGDILHVGENKHEIIIKTKKDLNSGERQKVFEALQKKYNLKDEDFREAEQFGPSIGKEIQKKAFLSVAIAAIGMLIYITFRFEFKFGASAIITLLHDILVVLAVFAIFRIPINSSFVAAMLTIVGYSINDTIVVFDRIRENIRFMKKKNYDEIVDISVNQTLTRSINTSLTTLITITALYVFGVESIKVFALPLIAGTITGTYSSIFIASPIWALWKNWELRKGRYNAG
ncbi:protein translocase subunit SecF [Crassaminicella indica]|uniref:Protein-export membrane protein SecF n=1 Tax=Crassaminicella indica TaxID=2855394 RepID=A0ABX8RAX3_9CLOT|nr:protein translocase subunit SecF [Crassaminicella indica]QXM05936.1 protein translocase subunit SecF [Crassaminicella indica]